MALYRHLHIRKPPKAALGLQLAAEVQLLLNEVPQRSVVQPTGPVIRTDMLADGLQLVCRIGLGIAQEHGTSGRAGYFFLNMATSLGNK